MCHIYSRGLNSIKLSVRRPTHLTVSAFNQLHIDEHASSPGNTACDYKEVVVFPLAETITNRPTHCTGHTQHNGADDGSVAGGRSMSWHSDEHWLPWGGGKCSSMYTPRFLTTVDGWRTLSPMDRMRSAWLSLANCCRVPSQTSSDFAATNGAHAVRDIRVTYRHPYARHSVRRRPTSLSVTDSQLICSVEHRQMHVGRVSNSRRFLENALLLNPTKTEVAISDNGYIRSTVLPLSTWSD